MNSFETIEKQLVRSDKMLFIKFRDRKITLDQWIARNFEKNGGQKFVVLDDLIDKLHPKIL